MNIMRAAAAHGVSKRLLNKVSDHPLYKAGTIVKMIPLFASTERLFARLRVKRPCSSRRIIAITSIMDANK